MYKNTAYIFYKWNNCSKKTKSIANLPKGQNYT